MTIIGTLLLSVTNFTCDKPMKRRVILLGHSTPKVFEHGGPNMANNRVQNDKKF